MNPIDFISILAVGATMGIALVTFLLETGRSASVESLEFWTKKRKWRLECKKNKP